jgi:hypothetical protein
MKILALETELKRTNKNRDEEILREEAQAVRNLMKNGILNDIYFDENRCAVLMLECAGKAEAEKILAELPLVKNGFIRFEIKELHPYTGFFRLEN